MAPARFIAGLLCRWRKSSSPSTTEPAHIALGREGEDLAVEYLRQNGYRVLYRNFRAPRGGEVDIVCRDIAGKTLVFAEVKTRRSIEHGAPSEAVTPAKQDLICRGALAWLRLLDNPDVPCRFDVIEVLVTGDAEPEVSVIRNAFELRDPYIY